MASVQWSGWPLVTDHWPLPNVAQHLAADAGLYRGAAGHHAPRGREDARAEPSQHIRHVVAAEIDPAAGTADALDTGDQLLAMRSVLEEQPQRLRRRRRLGGRLVERLEALDVAFVLQDARDLSLQPRRRHVHAGVLGRHRIADPGEHVCDWIGHKSAFKHLESWRIGELVNSPIREFTNSLNHQLLLVTPVMSPSSASLRKHRRQSANFRMKPRGRPHKWQRLRSRILYFGVFDSLAIFAVVAIS